MFQPRTVELLAYDCSILSHCLKTTQQHSVPLAGIETLLKQVMSRLTSLLSEYVKKEGTSSLLPVVHSLQAMVTFGDTWDLTCYRTAETVRGCVPTKLTDLLLELVSKKVSGCVCVIRSVRLKVPSSLVKANRCSTSFIRSFPGADCLLS